MRKVTLLLLLVLSVFGCQKEKKLTDAQIAKMPPPQTTGLPQVSGGMSISVENEVITSGEVIDALAAPLRQDVLTNSFETYASQYRPRVEEFVNDRITKAIVQQKAKKEAGDKIDERIKQVVDAEVKSFIAQFGGDYSAAEAAIKKEGFENWEDFREYEKKVILSQSYLAAKAPPPEPITYNEILAFYNKVKATDYTTAAKISFQLIDIQPPKIANPDPNVSTIQSAKELANSLVARIKAGEDFSNLASRYSNGPWAQNGGLFTPVDPNSLAEPYDILAREAKNIQTGQVAGPIETAEHIFIMKLLEYQNEGAVPLEKVQGEIKRKILLERRNKFIIELNEKIASQTSVANKGDFVEYCLAKIYEKNRKQAGSS